MRAIPVSSEFKLSDQTVRFGLSLATFSLLPNLPAFCHCDSELTPEHLISCKNAHDKLLRHNLVVSSFVGIATHHGVPSKQEPRSDYDDCKNAQRPDAVFFLPQEAVEVDVSITYSPVCRSTGSERVIPHDPIMTPQMTPRGHSGSFWVILRGHGI